MILVVDASVAIKWFIPEELEGEADAIAGQPDLVAPDLLFAEVGKALWGKATRGLIPHSDAARSLEALEAMELATMESPLLASRGLALALKLGHPIYDCIYLACAEKLGALLITADDRLFRKVRASPYAPLVHHLRDFQAS